MKIFREFMNLMRSFGNSWKSEGMHTVRGHDVRLWTVLAVTGLFLSDSAPLFAHQARDQTGKELSAAPRPERVSVASNRGGSRWGANYFPNVQLVTHEGKTVRFFDDLIKDKVVILYFMYTSCEDTCPLETARLVNVQRILGDRVGKDVFMYSITVDPANDTPEVLKQYAKKFQIGPGWQFLTGEEADITLLRKKLGLLSDADSELDPTDHDINLVLGNQRTGRWMKRSPFDNPYFLAAQVGSWLVNWTPPHAENNNLYMQAPKRRTHTLGETLFRGRCIACHTIGGERIVKNQRRLGPDLLGVTRKRDRAWLARLLTEPEKMLAEKDPIVMELYAKYNEIRMPNFRLSKVDVDALIDYMASESRRLQSAAAEVGAGGRP